MSAQVDDGWTRPTASGVDVARSAFDLFAIVKQIVDAKAQFRSLAEPWADTEARRRRAKGATLSELARSYDVSESTISRLV
jgi:hypothetical protein